MSTKLFVSTLELHNSRRQADQPSWLGRAVDGLRREWRIRSAAEDLLQCSDAQLRDLGIGRSEIGTAVRHGR